MTHKLYQFYLFLHERIEKFPKRKQYTIGNKLENLVLELLELSLLTRKKSPAGQFLILDRIDAKAKIIALLLRSAYETKTMPLTQQIIAQEKLLEIGRVLGGWIKNTKRPLK